jgi:hypothetical protein
MSKYVYAGEGVNRKTGKPITFRVPEKISLLGVDKIKANVLDYRIRTICPQPEPLPGAIRHIPAYAHLEPYGFEVAHPSTRSSSGWDSRVFFYPKKD